MKRNLRSLVTMSLIAGSLVMTSCGENKKEKEEAGAETAQHEMQQEDSHKHGESTHSHAKAETAELKFKDEKNKEVFNAYLQLKDALVKTDAAAAKTAAGQLGEELGDNQEAAAIAQKLAKTDDVNKQREIFSDLNKAMELVLKGSLSSGKIYKQFCPMAFEGKGDYWYSDSDQIRNPYFGDKMLKCGRVDDTIM